MHHILLPPPYHGKRILINSSQVKARLQIQYKNKEMGITNSAIVLYKGKCHSHQHSTDRLSGPVDCAKKVVQQLGIRRGLYRGWVPTALCRMSNWAYFGSYEFFKTSLMPHGDGVRKLSSLLFHLPTIPTKPKKLSLGASVLAGALAGGCYWLSCYPSTPFIFHSLLLLSLCVNW